MPSRSVTAAGIFAGVLATALAFTRDARACGCFSPPVPTVSESQYAINQQAEQILFEVFDDRVTAHVLIRYAGDPASFAWIVPVKGVPELALSPGAIFGILERLTSPSVSVRRESLCPSQEWECRYPYCYSGAGAPAQEPPKQEPVAQEPARDGAAAGVPDVVVYSRQQVGSYDTVVIGSADASAAGRWLRENGFIVNETMAPYMQPYLDEGFNFVASKLIPGAGASEVKPLRITYAGTEPMIPLRLTAVAAEPHLTVTAFIYGRSRFRPIDTPVPLTTVPAEAIGVDRAGRQNYPMALSRAIDEAGGLAFVLEYFGKPPAGLPDPTGCCGAGVDWCGIGRDARCQCPGAGFDADDCAGEADLVESAELIRDLVGRHPFVTRLTTRISPEEMSADPMFGPERIVPNPSRLTLDGTQKTLDACRADVIDRELHDAIQARQGCASVYCGTGECVITARGAAGCACYPGTVARAFTDLDGSPSVTCVPEVPSVDLAAEGLLLPNACAGIAVQRGDCLDLAGFPAVRCLPGSAAVVVPGSAAPDCGAVAYRTDTTGARDYSRTLEFVRVCAPMPPDCGETGWLVPRSSVARRGERCAGREPAPERLRPPEAPCERVSRADDSRSFDPASPNPFPGQEPATRGPSSAGPGGAGLATGGGVGTGCTAAGRKATGVFGVALLLLAVRVRRRAGFPPHA